MNTVHTGLHNTFHDTQSNKIYETFWMGLRTDGRRDRDKHKVLVNWLLENELRFRNLQKVKFPMGRISGPEKGTGQCSAELELSVK